MRIYRTMAEDLRVQFLECQVDQEMLHLHMAGPTSEDREAGC